jgi:hypothetical protein
MTRIASRRAIATFPLLAALGCVTLPLERENYFDVGSDTRFVVTGIPDTVNSVGEEFRLEISSRPAPPSSDVQFQTEAVVGAQLLDFQGLTTYRARNTIGLLPVRAIIRVSIAGVADGPVLDVPVVLRQRPRTASLACPLNDPCSPLAGVGTERLLRLTLRDSLAQPVNLPVGDFRYGEVVSRAPSIVEVAARPTPNDIRVVARGSGATWIVFLSESGASDSLRLEVLP